MGRPSIGLCENDLTSNWCSCQSRKVWKSKYRGRCWIKLFICPERASLTHFYIHSVHVPRKSRPHDKEHNCPPSLHHVCFGNPGDHTIGIPQHRMIWHGEVEVPVPVTRRSRSRCKPRELQIVWWSSQLLFSRDKAITRPSSALS
jgi:hypothetical protein